MSVEVTSSTIASSDSSAADERFLASRLDWWFVLSLAGLLPFLLVQFSILWGKQHLQFFPLALAAFATLIIQRGQLGTTHSRGRRYIAYGLAILGVVAAVTALAWYSPWFSHISLVLVCLSWMYARLAKTPWYVLLAWTGLLLVWLPLPMNLDQRLIQYLQLLSTDSASNLLDLISVPHFAFGNVLELRSGKLFVDEACSGVGSLYALAASALFFMIWNGSNLPTAAVSMAMVPLWAWLGNVVRIFSIAFLLHFFEIDLSHGWRHAVLGLVVFAAIFGALLVTANSLDKLFAPFLVRPSSSGSTAVHGLYNRFVTWPGKNPLRKKRKTEAESATQATVRASGGGFSAPAVYGVGGLMLLLGILSTFPIFGIGPWKQAFAGLPSIPQEVVDERFGKDLLPENLTGLRQFGFRTEHREASSFYGEHSAIWTYYLGERQVSLSLDFPFPGYHTLDQCYVLSGSQLLTPATLTEKLVPEQKLGVYDCQLQDQLRRKSYLCFAIVDWDGEPVLNPERLGRKSFGAADIPVTFQFQIFVEGFDASDEQTRQQLQAALLEAANLLMPHVQSLK